MTFHVIIVEFCFRKYKSYQPTGRLIFWQIVYSCFLPELPGGVARPLQVPSGEKFIEQGVGRLVVEVTKVKTDIIWFKDGKELKSGLKYKVRDSSNKELEDS